MDMLNFNKENVLVLEGCSIPDVPLSQVLVDHQLGDSALTQLVREVDCTNKPKVVSSSSNDTFDIFMCCDWPKNSKLTSELE